MTNNSSTISIVILCTCLCNSALCEVKVQALQESVPGGSGRLYDCGANALYVYMTIVKSPQTYGECLKMLPVREEGNSALEVVSALKECGIVASGWGAAPEEVSAITYPAILLVYPQEDDPRAVRRDIGHFLVIRPVGQGMLQILDPPTASNIVPASLWGSHMKKKGIRRIVVITPEMLPSAVQEPNVRPVVSAMSHLEVAAASQEPIIARYDLGTVEEGSVSKFMFKIVNDAEGLLKIQKMSSGCSCIRLECDREMLRKGEEAGVNVFLDHRGKSGAVIEGVVIQCDLAGIRQILYVEITGQIVPSWICEPAAVSFGRIDKESEAVQREIFVRAESAAIRRRREVPVVYSDDTRLGLEVHRTHEDGVYRCLITLHTAKCRTQVASRIQVRAGANAWAASSCVVTADIREPVQVVPERILLRRSGSVFRSVMPIALVGADKAAAVVESVSMIDVEKAKVRLSKLSDDNKGTYVELEASQDIPLHGEFRLDATIADRRFSVSVPVVITP